MGRCCSCSYTYTVQIPVRTDHYITGGDPFYIRSSDSNTDYFALTIEGHTLKLEGLFMNREIVGVMLTGSGVFGTETMVMEEFPAYTRFAAEYDISGNTADFSFMVFTHIASEQVWRGSVEMIHIRVTETGFAFAHSPVLENNLEAHRYWINPQEQLDKSEVTERVQALSDQIVGNATDDYEKLILLYNWVSATTSFGPLFSHELFSVPFSSFWYPHLPDST